MVGPSSGFSLAPGMWLKLAHRVFDAEGERVLSAADEVTCVFGYGALLPALEQRLDGLSVGDRAELTLRPHEAFGERDPNALLEIARDEFPEETAPGDSFEADAELGQPVLLQVLDVTPERVLVDANHPLAGQSIRVEVQVLEVRPASELELAAAEARLSAAPHEADALVPAERLIRGAAQRYEGAREGGARGADASRIPGRGQRARCSPD